MVNICLYCNKPIRRETKFTLKHEIHKSCDIKINKIANLVDEDMKHQMGSLTGEKK